MSMWTYQRFGLLVLSLSYLQACVANFTFTYNEATQCDDFQVSWTGGSPPFDLTLIPAYAVQSRVSIPDSSFSNNHGLFSTPIPYLAGNKIVVVMSDATGFGSGGVSPVITVGEPVHHVNCDTSDNPTNDFYFTNDDALTQCAPYHITQFSNGSAVLPVQLTGVVPGGSTFVLNVPKATTSYTWVTDMAAGTELILMMTDAAGKQGGNTDIMTVEQSTDASCLNGNFPASASNAPSMTSASTGSQTSSLASSTSLSPSETTSATTSRVKTGTPIAAVVAPVVGGVLLLIGAFLCWRKRRLHRRTRDGVRVFERGSPVPGVDLINDGLYSSPPMGKIEPPPSAVPLLRDRSPGGDGTTTHGSYSPRLPPSAPQGYPYSAMSSYRPSHDSESQYYDSAHSTTAHASTTSPSAGRGGSDSGSRRKAAEAGVLVPPGHHPSTQIILHTDIEDSVPPPVHEVIELPPQYSERRAPLPAASGSDAQYCGGGGDPSFVPR